MVLAIDLFFKCTKNSHNNEIFLIPCPFHVMPGPDRASPILRGAN